MRSLRDSLPAGNVVLLDSITPVLTDGEYTLAITQTLTDSSGNNVGAITDASQTFSIGGPRFTLPAAEVVTEFPPNGSTGTFGQYLPHVVLNQAQLPWERTLSSSSSSPWLALMVFQEGELSGSGNGLQTLTVNDLLNNQPSSVLVPSGLNPAPTPDELALTCTAITMHSATFAALVPTLNEVPHLAHARKVDVTGKALGNTVSDGVFAVVVGNRFPAVPPEPTGSSPVAGLRSVVHLVSLEGFSTLLSGLSPATPSPQTSVMMVSLYSWTFSCLPDPTQTFAGLAENLGETGTPPALIPAASLMLQLPYTPSSSTEQPVVDAQKRLNSGYVPLGYHAQSGEDGFAWYRGPLSPVVPNNVNRPGDFVTADAAMVYDQNHGVFDHSLAAAWQCGQSLALADQTYATTLMALRQKATDTLSQMALHQLLAPRPKQDQVADALTSLFATDVIRRLGQASPAEARAPRATRRSSASFADLRETLARPEVPEILASSLYDNPAADTIADWLGQLQLLVGVPFVHLVPNAAMLPAESIRFFFVDPNWIAALTAGALNIGIGTSLDAQIQRQLTDSLEQMAATAALSARALALGQPVPPAPPHNLTGGLLLRSALVSGWPGLSVSATVKGQAIAILRLDFLAPDVLFCLFAGLPDTVVLEEPHEGLQFGVGSTGCAEWRTLQNGVLSSAPGPLVYNLQPPAVTEPVTIRSGSNRVLNLNSDPNYPTTSPPTSPVDLLGTLAASMSIGTGQLGSAEFALQMMQGPATVTFTLPTLESEP